MSAPRVPLNLARQLVSSAPGTGNIALGAAYMDNITFATAGATNGMLLTVNIIDVGQRSTEEVVYSTTGPSLTSRSNLKSTTGSLLSLTSAAVVSCTISAEDLNRKSDITRLINAQTGTTYTFVLGDAGKLVTFANASAVVATVPPNSSVAFDIGAQIDVGWEGVGQPSIAAGVGVTINSEDSKLKINKRYTGGTLVKTATDVWTLYGNLAT